eukprot:TRINITY_DN6776_c0_g3_i1.p2 TRINITY_DN6776_c0_g3~~TRINITY_DN6776_c0_g3_i1.p2  ORF type:complete len:319 (-),score=48.85 TRINITY_DN6776_c0_g3_i1:166-1122(-)
MSVNLTPPNIKQSFEIIIENDVAQAAFDPPESTLAVISKNKIQLISVSRQLPQSELNLPNNSDEVNHISWSQSGNEIASASSDGILRVWDVRSPGSCQEAARFKDLPKELYFAKYHPKNNHYVVTAGFTECFQIWDVRKLSECCKSKECGSFPVTAIDFYVKKNQVVCGFLDGFVRGFDMDSGEMTIEMTEGMHAVGDAVVQNAFLLTGQLDGRVRLWNLDKQKMIKDYVNHVCTDRLLPCSFLGSRGQYVVSGSEDGKVFVWYLNKHKKVAQQIECSQNKPDTDTSVSSITICKRNKLFATSCFDGCVKVWSLNPQE